MQSRAGLTSPSKAFGLYASIEWGLRDVKFLSPHSFSASNGTHTWCFYCCLHEYDTNFDLLIPEFDDDYLILSIPNKDGDNCVLLEKTDCAEFMNQKVSMKWIATKIKRKWGVTFTT